jgi:hypothetical protein
MMYGLKPVPFTQNGVIGQVLTGYRRERGNVQIMAWHRDFARRH